MMGKWTTAAAVVLFVVWMQRHHRWGLLRTAMASKFTVQGSTSTTNSTVIATTTALFQKALNAHAKTISTPTLFQKALNAKAKKK